MQLQLKAEAEAPAPQEYLQMQTKQEKVQTHKQMSVQTAPKTLAERERESRQEPRPMGVFPAGFAGRVPLAFLISHLPFSTFHLPSSGRLSLKDNKLLQWKNPAVEAKLQRVLLFTRFTWLSARPGIKCNLKILKHFATSWQMKARPIMSTAKCQSGGQGSGSYQEAEPRSLGPGTSDTNNRKE